ncbi:MAG: diaminopimelate epimerase [Candidatus Omnitrophica bacterium]|nr:diaminopimelate epimerase [Candidatus Omnitrophota bacterium]
MKKIKFLKMDGVGNDFVVIDNRGSGVARGISLPKMAQFICRRKTSVGADGLLVLEKSRKADFRMRIFNADGSEAEMCGNGLRCAVLYAGKKGKINIETMAGMHGAEITGRNKVKINMAEPKGLKQDIAIKVNSRPIKAHYIDTGVPHAVIFVQGIDDIDVDSIGRAVRYHDKFRPRGTNVDFVEIMDDKNIKIRTYERGVEGETLACGTGAVASAIMAGSRIKTHVPGSKIRVCTRGGKLDIYFKISGRNVKDVYLEGEARKVYRGEVDYV